MSGLSVSSSDECSQCDLKVKNGISASVVDIQLNSSSLKITPSIPFEFTFNDKTVSVPYFYLTRPCPIRVENVQYDAALTLIGNNFSFILMIPIQATTTPDHTSDAFLNRIVSHIPNLVQKPTESISVPTGSDWSLTSILPLTGDAKGELTMQNPFFYWSVPFPGMDDVIQQIDNQNMYRRLLGQTPLPYPYTDDPRTKAIMMAKPATAGAFVMSCINLLPTTPAGTDKVPSKGVLYKPFICGESKGKKEKFTNKECSPFSVPPTPPPISSDMLVTVILSVLGAIAGFIGVYFAVKFAAGPTGDIMKKVGESLGRGLVAIKKSIPTVAPATTTPKESVVVMTENPMLTKTQEKIAEKSEPSIDEGLKALEKKQSEQAEKRLSTSLAKENPFFKGRTQSQFKEGKTRRNLPPPVKLTDAQIREAAAGTGVFGPGPTPADLAREARKELETRNVAPEGAKKRLIAVESERDLTPEMVAEAEKEYPQLKVGGPLPNGDNRTLGNKKYTPVSDEVTQSRRTSREADKPNPKQRASTVRRLPQ